MWANKLKLSPKKVEVLLVGKPYDLRFKISPFLDGVVLPLQEQVHNLGVLLDPGKNSEYLSLLQCLLSK